MVENRNYRTTTSQEATEIEEWEWHSNGVHDLMVVNIRYQSAEGPDVDVATCPRILGIPGAGYLDPPGKVI